MKEDRILFTIKAFVVFVAALLSFRTCTARADVPTVNKDRVVAIDAAIQQGGIFTLLAPMERMALQSHAPIDIIIASPGGAVMDGFLFVNEMESFKARGVKLRCFVPKMAASMAFQILVHCDERYTLDRAFLLWHRVRVSLGDTPLTSTQAAGISRDLAAMDAVILRELNATLGLSPEEVLYHLNAETFHVGESLARMAPGFIESYPYTPGLMEAWKSPSTPRLPKPKSALEQLFGSFQYIYIWEGAK